MSTVQDQIASGKSANLSTSIGNSVESTVSDAKTSEALQNQWKDADKAENSLQAEVTTNALTGISRIDFDSQNDSKSIGGVAFATASADLSQDQLTNVAGLLGEDLKEV